MVLFEREKKAYIADSFRDQLEHWRVSDDQVRDKSEFQIARVQDQFRDDRKTSRVRTRVLQPLREIKSHL